MNFLYCNVKFYTPNGTSIYTETYVTEDRLLLPHGHLSVSFSFNCATPILSTVFLKNVVNSSLIMAHSFCNL